LEGDYSEDIGFVIKPEADLEQIDNIIDMYTSELRFKGTQVAYYLICHRKLGFSQKE
jgi:hypothetical protein